ncbi:MAG: outer membrane beta-barrel protein [Sphingobacteriales bacterium]|nr:outer membrane beta-barrel protein [Sphingobacteriales bacterium]OJV98504.1 MAG: hypothetical protein BGO52_12025 [Sphingobacteriales bacterium 44-61]
MKKIMIIAVILASACTGFTQQSGSAFTANWNLGTMTSKSFVKGLSTNGVNIGYGQAIGKGFSAGLDLGWNTFYTYYPRQTNQSKDGAFTTDMYKSLFTVPVTVSITKNFLQQGIFSPYVKIGVGTMYSEQQLFYNIYEEEQSNWGFAAIPEIGLHIKTAADNRWAFNLGAQYRYATNKEKDYNINNLQSFNFNAGLSWSLR